MQWKVFFYFNQAHFYRLYRGSDLFNKSLLFNHKSFEVLRELFKKAHKGDKRWIKSSKVLTYKKSIRIWHLFWELMLKDLIMEHDMFIFPFVQFAILKIGETRYPWQALKSKKNKYINFTTNHKKIEVIFVSRKNALREIHFLYRFRLFSTPRKMFYKQLYENHFHYEDY